MLAHGAPGASRSSAPDLGAAAEGKGSATPALRKEKDAPYPSLVIRGGQTRSFTTVDVTATATNR